MHWYWLVSGVIMILLEFVIPGLVICFFGLSALIVSGLNCLFPQISLIWQLLIFASGGVVLAVLCRLLIPGIRREKPAADRDIDDDDVIGAKCRCCSAITPETAGKVEFRGSLWSAESDCNIAPGEFCTVEKRCNLTLMVKPLNK
ncbi:MAG: NfeD family protein [Lentisphaerae bacterium]|nr:NfeD family protein [Lentisphaerota bacterium]